MFLFCDSQLVEENRAPGNNNVGMVAWRIKMLTPEVPEGRELILIANDITFISGSFSPKVRVTFISVTRITAAV